MKSSSSVATSLKRQRFERVATDMTDEEVALSNSTPGYQMPAA